MTTKSTEESIRAEVKAILYDAVGDNNIYFSVRECVEKSSWCGKPTGMFQINIWSLAGGPHSRNRGHMFRTTKQGVIPAAKIREFAIERVAAKREAEERAAKREAVKESNQEIAAHLRHVRKLTDKRNYYSEFVRCGDKYISADSNAEGKVRIGLGDLVLTKEQALQLFALLDSFVS